MMNDVDKKILALDIINLCTHSFSDFSHDISGVVFEPRVCKEGGKSRLNKV